MSRGLGDVYKRQPGTLPPTLSPVPLYCLLSLPAYYPFTPPHLLPTPTGAAVLLWFQLHGFIQGEKPQGQSKCSVEALCSSKLLESGLFLWVSWCIFWALSEGHCYNDETGADIRGISSIQFTVCVVWISQTTGRDINVRGFFWIIASGDLANALVCFSINCV